MEIRHVTKEDIPRLVEFNERAFPNKNVNMEAYISFWFSKAEQEFERTLILLNNSQCIIGQNFFSTMSYFLLGQRYDSVWGFDLMVEKEYRKQNWGIDLLLACKKFEPNSFATGSGPDALKMNLKMGQKLLAEIKKYVCVVNPVWFITAIGRGIIPIGKFPRNINISQKEYHIIKQDELPVIDGPYNSHLLEIERDRNFLKWRFFNKLHDYAFYMENHGQSWFVLRTVTIKHTTILVLVDWRCRVQSSMEFEVIICACRRIANNLHIPVLITGSSLNIFDQVLENNHFKSIGRPRPVIGRIKIRDYQDAIDSRNFAFVTLADSDGETNWL